jgi:ADP-heptose:LPS heptosyltransferase
MGKKIVRLKQNITDAHLKFVVVKVEKQLLPENPNVFYFVFEFSSQSADKLTIHSLLCSWIL